MKQAKFKERLRYKIDTIMSRGTVALIALLAVITLVVVIVAGIAVFVIDKAWAEDSVLMGIWKSFTYSLDPGNLAGVSGSVGLIAVVALVTLVGLFIVSTLIGILSTGLSDRLDRLRRGSSRILEQGHTVILGFNEAVFSLLTELQLANANVKGACVVVLGQEDKGVMEEQIARRVPKSKNTRIIVRNGDCASEFDLARVSIETCKSVIVNFSEDTSVIRVILAVTNYLGQASIRGRFPASQSIHICAAINEADNLQVAQIAGRGFAEVMNFSQAIARIMAQVCYQPGLSSVYLELFDFAGDEIYIERIAELAGQTFGEACLAFDRSTVLGLVRDGVVSLNPPPTDVLAASDQLVLIASDDNASKPAAKPAIRSDLLVSRQTAVKAMADDQLLILGSNALLTDILTELNVYMPPRSTVTIANDNVDLPALGKQAIKSYANISVKVVEDKISRRETLERLVSQGINHILILSDATLSSDLADAKTLSILLHIRDLAQKHNLKFGVTSEMLDIRNQKLANGTNVSDFVISNNIVSLMLAQISENRLLVPIFTDLLDADGSEIYLKPAAGYVQLGQPVDLHTVAHAVAQRHEVFIGYKTVAIDADGQEQLQVITNPNKRDIVTFGEQDCLIVLAED